MTQKTTILDKPTITLPSLWKNSKVNILFPDDFTVIVKKIPTEREINYSEDEKNWKQIRPLLRKIRKEIFKAFYPTLYAKFSRKRT